MPVKTFRTTASLAALAGFAILAGCSQPDTSSAPSTVVVVNPPSASPSMSPGAKAEIDKARAKGAMYADDAKSQEKAGAKREAQSSPASQPQQALGIPTPPATAPPVPPSPPGSGAKTEAPGSSTIGAEQASPPPKGP